MAWVNLLDNLDTYPTTFNLPESVSINGNRLDCVGTNSEFDCTVSSAWPSLVRVRITFTEYSCDPLSQGPGSINQSAPRVALLNDTVINDAWPTDAFIPEDAPVVTEWIPSPFIFTEVMGSFEDALVFYPAMLTGDQLPAPYIATIVIEVEPVESEVVEYTDATAPVMVNEFEKGWSFDGMYIPHFAELNWWFGDDPVTMTGLQKLRIHGLSKGWTKLSLAVNSMETDMLDYEKWFSEPQWIDLPRNINWITSDYVPVTNYTDTASRGISTQMRFEGRNVDPTLPEPSHVIQVLVLQSSPQGTGASAN